MNDNFDNDFQSLLTEMVELAFEYVDDNVDEVDTVYTIGLIEKGYFFKTFYKIKCYCKCLKNIYKHFYRLVHNSYSLLTFFRLLLLIL